MDAAATDAATRVRELTDGKAPISCHTVGYPYFQAATNRWHCGAANPDRRDRRICSSISWNSIVPAHLCRVDTLGYRRWRRVRFKQLVPGFPADTQGFRSRRLDLFTGKRQIGFVASRFVARPRHLSSGANKKGQDQCHQVPTSWSMPAC